MGDVERSDGSMESSAPATTGSAQLGITSVQVSRYRPLVLQPNRSDGYWVEALHFDLEHDCTWIHSVSCTLRNVTVFSILIYTDRSGPISRLIEFLDDSIGEAEHKA
jgi:hypothetical protein